MVKSSSGRPKRVGEQVKKEIADLLTKGIKDPRVGFVSVMEVRMSPDLRYANVYVSLFGEEKERKSSLIGLQQASGFIRKELGKRLRIRYTPEVRFFEDTSLDRAFHLEDVFKELEKESQMDEEDEIQVREEQREDAHDGEE
jgi:ribosome-binding factor A